MKLKEMAGEVNRFLALQEEASSDEEEEEHQPNLEDLRPTVDSSEEETSETKDACGYGVVMDPLLDSSTLWDNEVLFDVTLVGKDDVKVPASRSILAAASKVFNRMFFGDFIESQSTTSNNQEVQLLQFDGRILQNLVEFIHTDTSQILLESNDNNNTTSTTSFWKNHLPAIIMLEEAATYFDLRRLQRRVMITIDFALVEDPSISFFVLEECRQSGQDELAKLSLSYIRSVTIRPHITAASNIVGCLSPTVLEEILSDNQLAMTELDVFNLLHVWATSEAEAENTTGTTTIDRISIAKEFVGKHIALDKIDSLELSTTVEESKLATFNQLAEAYKTQALSYRQGNITLLPDAFDQFRFELSNDQNDNNFDIGRPHDEKNLLPSSGLILSSNSKNSDSSLGDNNLTGTGGVLAAASKVFQKMLYGNSEESQSTSTACTEIQLNVLEIMLEYVHTGDTPDPLFAFDYINNDTFLLNLPSLMILEEAARNFHVRRLHDLVANLVLWKFRSEKFQCHITPASNVVYLSPYIMEQILKDDKLPMTELDVFNLLHLWATAEVKADSTTATATTKSDRVAMAKEFVRKHIALEKIDIEELSTIVESSGLATDKQLSEAWERNDKTLQVAFKKFRSRQLSNIK